MAAAAFQKVKNAFENATEEEQNAGRDILACFRRACKCEVLPVVAKHLRVRNAVQDMRARIVALMGADVWTYADQVEWWKRQWADYQRKLSGKCRNLEKQRKKTKKGTRGLANLRGIVSEVCRTKVQDLLDGSGELVWRWRAYRVVKGSRIPKGWAGQEGARSRAQ